MKNPVRQNREGFTLVELLVVLAILAVLIAIAVPSYLGFAEGANESVCSNSRGDAMRLYYPIMEMHTANPTQNDVVWYFTQNLDLTDTGDRQHFTGGCPSGGVWECTLSGGTLTVHCSKHDSSNTLSQVKNNIDKLMGISKLNDYFKGKAVGASLDSQGANFGIPIKQELAEMLGINADEFDFRIYKSANNQWRVYITDPLKSDGTVATARYVWDPTKNNGAGALVYGPEEGSSTVTEKNGFLVIDAEHSFPGKLQDGLFADSVTEQEKTNYNSVGRIS